MAEHDLVRRREGEQSEDETRLRAGGNMGSRSCLGSVYNGGSKPATLPAIILTHPIAPGGNQTEGTATGVTVNAMRTRPFAVFGTRVPADGEILVAYWISGRWCAWIGAQGGGSSTVTIPGCVCTNSPLTISMTVTNPTLNNQIFNSCTIHYGPTPSVLLPVVLTASSYLSETSFHDPILNNDYFYLLTCTSTSYVLTRVYPSAFGGPFRDQPRYQWSPGFPGNTCSPFLMSNGRLFTGGDPRTTCTLSG